MHFGPCSRKKRNASRLWSHWCVCPSLLDFWFCGLFFPGSSLPIEAPFIGTFSAGHSFRKVSIECGANFFETDFVHFRLLPWKDRNSLHTIPTTNKAIHASVP